MGVQEDGAEPLQSDQERLFEAVRDFVRGLDHADRERLWEILNFGNVNLPPRGQEVMITAIDDLMKLVAPTLPLARRFEDKVNPKYYDGDECMRFIDNHGLAYGFCIGTAVKYLWRAGRKESETREIDLKKAAWYLDWYLKKYSCSERASRVIKSSRLVKLWMSTRDPVDELMLREVLGLLYLSDQEAAR